MFTRSTLLAFVAAVAAAPAPEAEPFHLPIGRRSLAPLADGTADFAAFLKELNTTLKKYKAGHELFDLKHYMGESLLGGVLEERATGSEKLIDQFTQGEDLLYYGTGNVGKQSFTIDFDTGSADFFVPGPNCPTCHGTPYNQGGKAENTQTSVTYGSGQVSGNNYLDTVCVAGLCAPNTNVISLTSAQGFSTSKSSSLMGMGFSTIAESKQATFFERLMAIGKVTKNEFAFYLGRGASKTQKNSQLTLGGVDTSKFTGKPKSHPVTKKGYWQLKVDGMGLSGSKALLTGGQAAIDTGTTVIIAPTVAATSLFVTKLLGVPIPLVATGSATETAFAYPCDTKKSLQIIFGGVSYDVNPLDLNLGTFTPAVANKLGIPALSGLCLASVIAADINPGQELYVVGDSFLKNWYSVYNYDNGASVSFAKALTNDDGPPSPSSSPYISTFVRVLTSPPFNHTVTVVVPSQQRSWIGKAHLLPPSSFPIAAQHGNVKSKNEDVSDIVTPTYYDPVSGKSQRQPPSERKADHWVTAPGTPATCVQLALFHHSLLFPHLADPSVNGDAGPSHGGGDARKCPFDLIVSGPNYGRNTTAAFALSSGTIGGALEGAVCGIRAVALSFAFFTRQETEAMVEEASTVSARLIERLWRDWEAAGATDSDTSGVPHVPDLYSINVPLVTGVSEAPIHWTWMLSNQWSTGSLYKPVATEDVSGEEPSQAGPSFRWSPNFGDVWKTVEESAEGNDGKVIREKQISVTPLKANFHSLYGVGAFTGEVKL